MIRAVCFSFGMFFVFGVALDAFQTIILPRRPTGRFRITRLFFLFTWHPWSAAGNALPNRRLRDQFYSIYGPLSLLALFAVWALLLIFGFASLFFALGSPFADPLVASAQPLSRFGSDLYVSGTTLFTLGLGDVTPRTPLARALEVVLSGAGLAFIALVIGYVPVIYQAFSRREVSVAMLDGRAGSPPTASELLERHSYHGGSAELAALLAEWERWSAEILETHVSYPILCYYRSQHDNQSWLSALVAVLDACAVLITNMEGTEVRQAQLTFAMGRHALVDLGHIFRLERRAAVYQSAPAADRLTAPEFTRLCTRMAPTRMHLCGDAAALERLHALRGLYEPHAQALAEFLKLSLPLWIPEAKASDPWKTVSALRMQAPAETMIEHVSGYSTSTHLQDE